jgi:hypothetical protein
LMCTGKKFLLMIWDQYRQDGVSQNKPDGR